MIDEVFLADLAQLTRGEADLKALRRAMVVVARSKNAAPSAIGGYRRAAVRGEYDKGAFLPAALVQKRLRSILAVTVDDMPPDPHLVRVLLETLCIKRGAVPHTKAWAVIGIPAGTGKDMLADPRGLRWPVWFTLRNGALGV